MKAIIKIKLITLLWGIACAGIVQGQSRHEFTLGGGAGLSTLQYKPSMGEKALFGFGGHAALGYTFFLSPQWGLGTGAELAFYNSKTTAATLNTSYLLTPNPSGLPDDLIFQAAYSTYEESQSATFINIPLMLQFQTKGRNKFYSTLGGKIGIPISAGYEASSGSLTTSAYSASADETFRDMPSHGFGTYPAEGSEGDLDIGLAYIASMEAGVKWRLGEKNFLYTGIYADYGFNGIRSDASDRNLVNYDPANPSQRAYVSLLQSTNNGTPYVDKVSPLAVGLKVKIAFGAGKRASKQQVQNAHLSEVARSAKTEEDAVRAAEAKRLTEEQTRKQAAELAQREAAEAERLRKAEQNRLIEQQKRQDIQLLAQPVKYYHLSQTILSPEQQRKLDEKIAVLQKYPEIQVLIEGHTCDIGGDEVNARVGLARAEKAKEYFVQNGIESARISTLSRGSSEPLVPNTGEENRRINRRVVLKME